MSRPNILFLMSDQHNAKCLGAAGHPLVRTPHLDRLAAEGLRFTSAYCQNPICTPSRMCSLTSQYCHNHGYYGLKGPRPERLPNLFSHFRAHGYQTAAVGKVHLPDGWIEPDCDFFCEKLSPRLEGMPSYREWVADQGVSDPLHPVQRQRQAAGRRGQSVDGYPDVLPKELSQEGYQLAMAREFLSQRRTDQPFLLWFSTGKPHQEYKPAEEFWELYPDRPPMPPNADDDPRLKIRPLRRSVYRQREHPPADLEPADYQSLRFRKLRGYYGNVTHMDWAMGEMIAMIEAAGLRQDTIIVYTSDHGDFACEHGLLEKAPGISADAIGRVPMIWSQPGRIPGGECRAQLTESLDILPTLASLAGLPPLAMWDGRDLTPAFADPYHPVRDAAFTENPLIKTITTDRWRLTWVPPSMFPGDAVAGELYDRLDDPWERRNLFAEPGYGAVVRDLTARLFDWLVSSSHPVTAWPVAAHPSVAQEPAGGDPQPEDGRTAPAQLRDAIDRGQTNYL